MPVVPHPIHRCLDADKDLRPLCSPSGPSQAGRRHCRPHLRCCDQSDVALQLDSGLLEASYGHRVNRDASFVCTPLLARRSFRLQSLLSGDHASRALRSPAGTTSIWPVRMTDFPLPEPFHFPRDVGATLIAMFFGIFDGGVLRVFSQFLKIGLKNIDLESHRAVFLLHDLLDRRSRPTVLSILTICLQKSIVSSLLTSTAFRTFFLIVS